MSTCGACGSEVAAGAVFCSACGVRLAGAGARPEHLASAIRAYHYVPHPHIEKRKAKPPKKTHDLNPRPGSLARFNAWLGVRITNGVGTMWCAYVFAALALISLPDAITQGKAATIAWIAQTFLQLVLLSIIMVGQKVEGAASENRAIDTYKDAEALLAEVMEIQKHLLAQDASLQHLIDSFPGSAQVPAPTPPE